MTKQTSPFLPRLTHEQRLAAAGQFERANQVLATGNLDYGMQLLLNCCLIDPGNPSYRQALRQAQKSKYENNLKGQKLAFLTTLRSRLRVQTALKKGNYIKVLEHAEQVFLRNPWEVSTHLAVAEAYQKLDLSGMAMWTLDQARQVDEHNPKINRPLARLFEKVGNFNAATALWELIRKANPSDKEAQDKYKDLAASATIAKGRYEDAIQGAAPTPLVPTNGEMNDTTKHAAAVESTEAQVPRVEATGPVQVKLPPMSDRASREVTTLQAKIQANPTNANAYLHLAAVYRRAEQWDRARKTLEAGLGPTANHFDIVMELIDLDIETFRHDLAVAEERLHHQPGNQELQAIRTRLAKEIATRELDFYRRKSERFPNETNHRFELGVRLLKVGQIDEAIRELQAIRHDPRHQGKALVYLGFCFKSRNNWRLAQRNFEEALTQLNSLDDSLRKEVLYQLAKGYAESGDLTRAVDLACDLANRDFSYKDISKLLDDWNAKMQKA